jgi:lipopolysaccharide export system protein LptA
MMRMKSLCISMLLACVTVNAQTLSNDDEQPIFIKADFARIDNQNGTGYYQGNVELDQGVSHIRADIARTYVDDNNQLLEAIVESDSQQRRAYFWTLREDEDSALHAKADKIKYIPANQRVYLMGNAQITQDDNIYRAPHIEYDTVKQGIMSPATNQGRTEIIIQRAVDTP